MEKRISEKSILILGSGMMVEPLIDLLLKRSDNNITIATNIYQSYKSIVSKRPTAKLNGVELDVVKQSNDLENLVSNFDIVISYLPPVLHEFVARACLKKQKNMVTTSYIGDFMKKIDQEVKEKNLIFMNEIGLDPGIDHLITHKVINDCERKGYKIIHYESWCGALCSPEFLNNPLLYKFSWSPRGALNALRNNVRQLINNDEIKFSNKEFLMHTTDKKFHPCFNFEGYYNRESLNYKDLYNLKDANTVIRGTIRFQGFSFVFQSFKNLGLFEDEKFKNSEMKIWKDYFYKEIICIKENAAKVDEFKYNLMDKYGIKLEEIMLIDADNKNNFEEYNFYIQLVLYSMYHFEEGYIKKYGFENLLKKFYSVLKYLELFKENTAIKSDKILDAFATLLEEKLKMEEWERDLVFMQNEFVIKTKENNLINKKYDLLVFGGHNKMPYSATSLLVSLPCATVTQLILDGKITERGVLMPTTDIIIDSVLENLEKHRIYVTEEITKKPKF